MTTKIPAALIKTINGVTYDGSTPATPILNAPEGSFPLPGYDVKNPPAYPGDDRDNFPFTRQGVQFDAAGVPIAGGSYGLGDLSGPNQFQMGQALTHWAENHQVAQTPAKPPVEKARQPQEVQDWLDTAGDYEHLPAWAAAHGYELVDGVYVKNAAAGSPAHLRNIISDLQAYASAIGA